MKNRNPKFIIEAPTSLATKYIVFPATLIQSCKFASIIAMSNLYPKNSVSLYWDKNCVMPAVLNVCMNLIASFATSPKNIARGIRIITIVVITVSNAPARADIFFESLLCNG